MAWSIDVHSFERGLRGEGRGGGGGVAVQMLSHSLARDGNVRFEFEFTVRVGFMIGV